MLRHIVGPCLLGLVGMQMLLSGCTATVVTRLDFTFSRVAFSERIRPDLGPLSAPQRTLTTFSDGGANGDELVALLLPMGGGKQRPSDGSI